MFNVSTLSKEIDFPSVKAIPEEKIKSFWKRFKTFLVYRRKWLVTEDYIIWSEVLQEFIFIPEGFLFDAASVPKPLYSVLSPTGLLLLGACPHDFGYVYNGLIIVDKKIGRLEFKPQDKKTMDNVFRDLCERENGFAIATSVAKIAVHFGGVGNFKKPAEEVPNVLEDFEATFIKHNGGI